MNHYEYEPLELTNIHGGDSRSLANFRDIQRMLGVQAAQGYADFKPDGPDMLRFELRVEPLSGYGSPHLVGPTVCIQQVVDGRCGPDSVKFVMDRMTREFLNFSSAEQELAQAKARVVELEARAAKAKEALSGN